MDSIPVVGEIVRQGYLPYIVAVLALPVLIVIGRAVVGALRSAEAAARLGQIGPFKKDPLREARKHEQKKDWESAAKAYEEAGQVDAAIRCYRALEDHRVAGKLLERHERFAEAEEIYREIGADQELVRLWGKAGNWAALGEHELRNGKQVNAAEAFARAGDHARAGECYAAAENFENAALHFEQAGEFGRAGEFYEKAFLQERVHAGRAGDKALKAAECYLRSRQHAAAGRMLETAERWEDAAKSFRAAGDPGKAGELFYRARNYEEAARNLEEAGLHERARHVLGEMHEFAGRLAEAGECYRMGNNQVKAGEMFEAAGMPMEAGACYEEMGDFVSAAECHLRAGNDERAAELFEMQGRFGEAAPLWLKTGRMDRAIPAFDRAGHYYDAGLLLNQMGRTDEAIALLQKLEPDSPGFPEGQFVLGNLFRRKKHYDLAADAFRKAAGGRPAGQRNLEIHYHLADTLAAAGERQEALKIYQAILTVKFDYRDVRERVAQLGG